MKITRSSLPVGSNIIYKSLGENTLSEYLVTEWSKKGFVRLSDDESRGTWWTREQIEKLYIEEVIKPPGYEPEVKGKKLAELEGIISERERSIAQWQDNTSHAQAQVRDLDSKLSKSIADLQDAQEKARWHDKLVAYVKFIDDNYDDADSHKKMGNHLSEACHLLAQINAPPSRHVFWTRGKLNDLSENELKLIFNELKAGNVINAIKTLRSATGYQLIDAKLTIDAWRAGNYAFQPKE
jgi:hypothetical protein